MTSKNSNATLTFSRELAPVSVDKTSLMQLEDSLQELVVNHFRIFRDKVQTTLTVVSQDVSEMASGTRHYQSSELPKELEHARLVLHYEPIDLVILLEVSPIRQGKVILTCNVYSDASEIGLKGLWLLIQKIPGVENSGPPAKLIQPSTTRTATRIPSCRISREDLERLEGVVEQAFTDFLNPFHVTNKDLEIQIADPGGCRTVASFREACERLHLADNLEISIERTAVDRSAKVVIDLHPRDNGSQIEVRLTVFDDPKLLNEAAKISREVTERIAHKRTFNYLLYWNFLVGLFVWAVLTIACMAFVESNPLLWLPPLGVPLAVVAARRRYPYIIFEPFKLGTFDHVLGFVVGIGVSLIVLPRLIAWFAGSG
jgi:hypothetical protein